MSEGDGGPSISVVIPAYNQVSYVGIAIESALAQEPPAAEIIVVDDGSSDGTADVLERFGTRIIVVRQANRGLAGARNAGIAAAAGTHVALLDADDEWMPAFLPAMRRLLAVSSGATACFGAAELVDAAGRLLPQRAGPHAVPPERILERLLRANFLLPSTMLLARAPVMAAGGFRSGFAGVEDHDLWLRLLRQGGTFIGTTAVVARYRIHGASMSADHVAMHAAHRVMIADLFGAEDGDLRSWPHERQRAWAGHYRYVAMTSVSRAGDWAAAASALARALTIDPSLATDADLFHELALGDQPLGWRGTRERIDVRANARALSRVIERVFASPSESPDRSLRPAVERAALLALADVGWQVGDRQTARRALTFTARRQPADLLHPAWWRHLARTYLPESLLAARRRWEGRGVST